MHCYQLFVASQKKGLNNICTRKNFVETNIASLSTLMFYCIRLTNAGEVWGKFVLKRPYSCFKLFSTDSYKITTLFIISRFKIMFM